MGSKELQQNLFGRFGDEFSDLEVKTSQNIFWHDPLDWESYWGPSRVPHLWDLDPFCWKKPVVLIWFDNDIHAASHWSRSSRFTVSSIFGLCAKAFTCLQCLGTSCSEFRSVFCSTQFQSINPHMQSHTCHKKVFIWRIQEHPRTLK